MRYFLLLLLFSFTFNFNAQVLGDITGDEIIDANDYLLLKEYILKGNSFKEKADLDKDKVQSVRDLVILYDFLYENGTQISSLEFEEKKEIVNISFGQFNSKNNSLEIIIRSKGLKAFEFVIPNLNKIELLKSNKNIHVLNNKVIGFNSKNSFAEELILHLNLSTVIEDEYCLEKTLFVDEIGNSFKIETGDCANSSWSLGGLAKVKADIDKNGFDALSDIDRNGVVDIKDYAVLFDYLNLNGPTPPGNDLATNKKLKLEFVPSEKEQDFFELLLTSNEEIAGFDLSFYGLKKINGLSCSSIDDIEYTNDRILWLGNGEEGLKEIRLKINYEELSKIKKICMRAPVFLDENHQYFGVKLGKCFDIFVPKVIVPPVIKEKKVKPSKLEKVKKEKEPKKVKEKKEKSPKEKIKKEKKKKKVEEELITEEGLKENNTIKEVIEDSQENTSEQNIYSENKLSGLKNVNEISNREKKKNIEANNPENKSTVKILSLNKLQIKTTIGQMGQMIFNNEDKVFMLFNGLEWKRLDVIPNVSIEE
ncbi:dockerin type I domain-containing protein [Vicingaceae bacterium]|nr:dockerin type I domain-containing protein [Vicingaceae bacterium]